MDLNTHHQRLGGSDAIRPTVFMALPSTQQLIAALGPDADACLPLAYTMWASAAEAATMLRRLAGTPTRRPVAGRLAGIDTLQPGQSMSVPAGNEPSLRCRVTQLQKALGRRFSVAVRGDVAVVTRTDGQPARQAPRPAPAPAARPWNHRDRTPVPDKYEMLDVWPPYSRRANHMETREQYTARQEKALRHNPVLAAACSAIVGYVDPTPGVDDGDETPLKVFPDPSAGIPPPDGVEDEPFDYGWDDLGR